MKRDKFGSKIEAHALAAPAAQYVADMALAGTAISCDLGLGHPNSEQVADHLGKICKHGPFYRYRALIVKRHSDYFVLQTTGMESLASRLKHARRLRGLNQAQLAKKAGLKNQSIIGSLESGHRKSSTYTPAIAQALAVSALWLSDGKGPMVSGLPASEEDTELLEAMAYFAEVYKASPVAGRKLLMSTIEGVQQAFLSRTTDKTRKQG